MSKLFFMMPLLAFALGLQAQTKQTFTNPLLPSGADPWAIYYNGHYYYTHTLGNRIALWKTKDLHALKDVTPKTVWTPPPVGPNSKAIWAPELHSLDNKWYIYYTATDKANDGDANRYVFVLENASADPLEDTWMDRGKSEYRIFWFGWFCIRTSRHPLLYVFGLCWSPERAGDGENEKPLDADGNSGYHRCAHSVVGEIWWP